MSSPSLSVHRQRAAAARRPLFRPVVAVVLAALAVSWLAQRLWRAEDTSLRPQRFETVAVVQEARAQGEFLRLVLAQGSFDQLPRAQQERVAAQLIDEAGRPVQTCVIETPAARYMVQRMPGGRTLLSSVHAKQPPGILPR